MAKFAFNSSFYREGEENFHSITCENREQYKYEAKCINNSEPVKKAINCKIEVKCFDLY